MSEYTDGQREAFEQTAWDTATCLRALADRIERGAQTIRKVSSTHDQALDIVGDIHSTLANLPLYGLLRYAHEASPRAEEKN